MIRTTFPSISIFLISCLAVTANGANILGIFTSHSPSHLIIHMSTVNVLAERGHNITVVASYQPKIRIHKDIRMIVIPPTAEEEEMLNKAILNMASENKEILLSMKTLMSSMKLYIDLQAEMMKDTRFTQLYDNPDTKFDLVICGFFMNSHQLGVAAKFKAPVIVSWTSAPIGMVGHFVGNPSDINSYMTTNENSGKINVFLQRVKIFFSKTFFAIMSIMLNIRLRGFYKDLFPVEDGNFPTLEDMYKNVSLLFCNSHFSEGYIGAKVPAVVEIGGIQIKDKPDKLPKDIAEFLNTANNTGAILFSLGTNFKGTNVKPETATYIFNVLSNLRQKVIWKWEDLEHTPGNASNILYKKWLPQDDILAHPNTKVFITHAGKGGTTEAQYHGVPMLAMPIFGDQHQNAEKMVQSGYGQMVTYSSLTEAEFETAILEVLNNPKYAENVQRFSRLYRDRPMSARENVVFWVEYVLRHHGARHMQSPLVHMNFIESTNLDVYTFLLLAVYIFYRIVRYTSCFVWRKMFVKSVCLTGKLKENKKLKKQ